MRRPWLLCWLVFLASAAVALLLHPAPRWRSYRVRPGDTLYSIARDHCGDGRAYRLLAAANRLEAPYRLAPGQRLILPDGPGPGGRYLLLAGVCLLSVLLLPVEAAALYAAGKAAGGLPLGRAVEAASLGTLITAGGGMLLVSPWVPSWWVRAAVAVTACTVLRVRATTAVFPLGGRRAALVYAASRPVVVTGAAFVLLVAAMVLGERLAPVVAGAGLGFILR